MSQPPDGEPPSEPQRPKHIRAPDAPATGRMDDHHRWAHEAAKQRNAQLAAEHQSKAAVRADIQKAQRRPPEAGQTPDPAPNPGPQNLRPGSKAGIQADLYKAMQSQPQKSGPSRDGGRGR